MINFYISRDNILTEIETAESGCWINVVNPSLEDRIQLLNEFKLNEDFLEDALDAEESPRIDYEDGQTFILINIPVKSHEENEYYDTIPFAIILKDNSIMTICLEEDNILSNIFKNKVKSFYTQYKTRFVLQILQLTAKEYLRDLKVLDKLTNRIESGFYKSIENSELLDMLKIEKSLVYFSTSLLSNETVLEKLLRHDLIKNYPEDQNLLEDVITDNKQAIGMCKTYTNILSSTMETYASIISNNQNDVMKILTSVTLVMSIPTIVSGIYGMNVALPFMHSDWAFIGIIVATVVISIVVMIILRKVKML